MRVSARTFMIAAFSVGIWAGLATAASAQQPIRIGASLSKTGEYAWLMKELDVNPLMFGVSAGVDLPRFYKALGRSAEFVYGSSQWEPELGMLRAGGLTLIRNSFTTKAQRHQGG